MPTNIFAYEEYIFYSRELCHAEKKNFYSPHFLWVCRNICCKMYLRMSGNSRHHLWLNLHGLKYFKAHIRQKYLKTLAVFVLYGIPLIFYFFKTTSFFRYINLFRDMDNSFSYCICLKLDACFYCSNINHHFRPKFTAIASPDNKYTFINETPLYSIELK